MGFLKRDQDNSRKLYSTKRELPSFSGLEITELTTSADDDCSGATEKIEKSFQKNIQTGLFEIKSFQRN